MAVVHQKKAGQWGKAKARREWFRTIEVMVVLLPFLGAVPGFVWGRYSLAGGILAFCGAAVVVWWIVTKLEKLIDQWNKERIKYLRGAQAEALVAWRLQELPHAWHVFNNLPCAAGGDVDHIVVGPSGVFVISTKSFKGLVDRAANGTVRMNGQPFDALDEAMTLAMGVRNRLKNTIGESATPWVQPVLALPLARVDVPRREGKVWVMDEDDITDTFEDTNGKPKLSAERIQRIADELDRAGATV